MTDQRPILLFYFQENGDSPISNPHLTLEAMILAPFALADDMSAPDEVVADIPEEIEDSAKEGAGSHESHPAGEGERLEHGVNPEPAVVGDHANPRKVNETEKPWKRKC